MAKNEQLNNEEWRNATGKIDYCMTNDYMFRMVLQSNNNVLKGLISSMMHVPLSDIKSVEIVNPIELGKHIDDKDFILDVKVMLNDNSIINLEMQVTNCSNWTNRSLCYLCRTFDNVQKGEDYNSAIPVTHIGFLDYDLFPDELEFYSTYMLQNVETGKIYNSKFRLSVLSLNQIKLATKEDKKWHIDEWARLFKATTWEELKMIAEKDKVYSEAANSIYVQNSDETIRAMCEARQEAIFHEQYVQKQLKELQEARDEAIFHEQYVQKQLKELKDARDEAILHEQYVQKQLSEKDAKLSEQQNLIEQLQAENKKLKEKLK
ncbi:MAG: Rpn family recombination-promoting nuclease/putative transposase [Lachnospiraceae bacterium]|nr:Rpn family recombination-promoting nuclease/putative transposase [Lachnospiraceae bacterium]